MRIRRTIATPIIGLLVLLSLAMAAFSYYVQVNALERALSTTERARVGNVALVVKSLIEDETPRLSALATVLAGNAGLVEGFRRYSEVGDINVLREHMAALYPHLDVDMLSAVDRAERMLFQAGKGLQSASATPIWGVYEALAGKPMLVTSKGPEGLAVRAINPVHDSGRVLGAVMVTAAFDDKLARHLAQETGADVSFATRAGVWASSLPVERRHALDEGRMTDSLVTKEPVFVVRPEWQKARLYFPFTIIDETFHIIIETSTKGSDQLIVHNKGRLLELSAVMLILVVGAGSAFTLYLVRPLRRLQARSLRLAKDISGHELTPARGNEIDSLVLSFGRVAETLELHTRDLASAKQAAEQGNRAKSQFLATMSHEIRTPMNGLLGMAEILLGTELSKRQQQLAKGIYGSGQSLLGILNDVLDFSKIEAGMLILDQASFDLRQALEETAELMAYEAQAKGLELICDLPDYTPTLVRGDSRRLRQVLINLLGNAIKFTERGEVLLRMGWLERGEGWSVVRFEVEDTGIGIPLEVQGTIFEPFVQGTAGPGQRFGGTGLGLAVCRELSRLMGGDTGVESEVGRGSTFWFTVRFEQPDGMASRPATVRQGLRGVSCLVLGGGERAQSVLSRHLAAWNVHWDNASDVDRGLTLLRSASHGADPYRFVLLDGALPDSEQARFLRDLVQHSSLAGTRVIALVPMRDSAHTTPLPTPLTARLSKPIRWGELYDLLAEAVGMRSTGAVTQATARESVPQPIGARVLLVEDHPVSQEVGRQMLETVGCSVVVAADGAQALAALRQESYDLVFMDCGLPDIDGYEVTREVRGWEKGTDRHIPIVALTANALPTERERCITAGMDDFLSKPYMMEQLRGALTRWVRRQSRVARKEATNDTRG